MMSTADKLSDMHPSRKNDMIQLFFLVAVLIHKLPYLDYFFTNVGRIPKAALKASLLAWKKSCTAEKYCSNPTLMFIRPYLEEVLSMQYEEEPNYGKLKFLLTKSLLEKNLVPSTFAFSSSSLVQHPYSILLQDISIDESNHKAEQEPLINRIKINKTQQQDSQK